MKRRLYGRVEALVAGEYGRGALVAAAHQLEEEHRAGPADRQVADLIHHHQRREDQRPCQSDPRLYLNPPAHAVVFCVDEKTAIQDLDRRDPVLPLSPGRAERHGFEYVRHGTLSLYAALNVGTGAVEGMTAARHTSADFLAFLDRVIATQPRRRAIHLIVDNLSAHKTKAVEAWLVAHSRVQLHYTPTDSSWLNQVELWFAKIERDCIARGIFTSTADLRRKLMQYIRAHNKTCHPFVWSYSDPTRRIRVNANSVTVH